jgi:hypothetical protein
MTCDKIASLLLVDAAQLEVPFRVPDLIGDALPDLIIGDNASPRVCVHDGDEEVADLFGGPVDGPNEKRKL